MVVTVTVREIMQTPVATAAPDERIAAVARTFVDRDVGSVVVVDGDRPIGIVTDDEVIAHYVDQRDPDTPVGDVMATPIVTVAADASIDEAAALMRDEGVKKLPVCDADGCLAGIVTTTDLSYYLPELAHPPTGPPERSQRRRRTRPDTAYEDDAWDFESYGAADGVIDVGDTVTFAKTIDADDVETFAEASGDTNRVHLDAAYAARTRFGERIVHGTLVSGLVSAALARLPGLIIYLSQEVTFRGPVAIGERVTAHCEVAESLGGDRYRLNTEVLESDDEVVIEGQATVLADDVPAEPADDASAGS